MPSSEVEKHPVQTPDPHDEPSVGWGWHGTLPKGAQIAGWCVAILMFGLLIGNQVGHVQDFYLAFTGAVMIFLLLTSARRRRRQRR